VETFLCHDDICCHDDWCCHCDNAGILISVLVEAVGREVGDYHGDYVLVDLGDISYHCDVLICHVGPCRDVLENGDVEEGVVVAEEEAEMVFLVIDDLVCVLVLLVIVYEEEISGEVDMVEDDDGEDLVTGVWHSDQGDCGWGDGQVASGRLEDVSWMVEE